MNLTELDWNNGCCARTAQFNSGDYIVLVTNTYESDDYRVEVYLTSGGLPTEEKHHLTEQEAQDTLKTLHLSV